MVELYKMSQVSVCIRSGSGQLEPAVLVEKEKDRLLWLQKTKHMNKMGTETMRHYNNKMLNF